MQLRFIFHEITGSVPGILQRFHITTLDPEDGVFPGEDADKNTVA